MRVERSGRTWWRVGRSGRTSQSSRVERSVCSRTEKERGREHYKREEERQREGERERETEREREKERKRGREREREREGERKKESAAWYMIIPDVGFSNLLEQ